MPAPQMSDDDENGGASSGAPPEPPKIIRVQDLTRMTASELLELAESQGLENIARIKKQDLVFKLLRADARRGEQIPTEGVLEIMQDGYGFLRGPDHSSQIGRAHVC